MAAETVKSITIGANGTLNVSTASPLASLVAAAFNSGSTLNIVGSITTPDLLMTYGTLAGATGTFSNIYNNGFALSGDSLQISGGSVEVVTAPTATATTYTLVATANGQSVQNIRVGGTSTIAATITNTGLSSASADTLDYTELDRHRRGFTDGLDIAQGQQQQSDPQ